MRQNYFTDVIKVMLLLALGSVVATLVMIVSGIPFLAWAFAGLSVFIVIMIGVYIVSGSGD